MRPRIILFALLFALVVAYSVTDYALIDVQRYAIEGRGWGTMQTGRGAAAATLTGECAATRARVECPSSTRRGAGGEVNHERSCES